MLLTWNGSRLWPSGWDILAVFIISLFVGGYYLISKRLSNPIDIPNQFWYHVPQSSDEQLARKEKEAQSRNISHAIHENDLQVVIFWGSQSGRAEVLARRLAKGLEDRFGLRTLVADLDDYDHVHLTELRSSSILCFILSTYGDGDPPDNSNGLWNAITRIHKDSKDLSNLRYTLFGLGNSKYRQYNRVADRVDLIFQSRGAIRLGEVGRGDDANGSTEDNFLTWRQATEEVLKARLRLVEQNRAYMPAFEVQEVDSPRIDSVYLGEPHSSMLVQRLSGRLAVDVDVPSVISIVCARKLWESNDRLCLHVEFDLGATRFMKYKTGDHVAIWPSNPDHEVDKLLSILGLEKKRNVVIESQSKNEGMRSTVPSPTTIEALFRYYLEIVGILSRETLNALTAFAPSDDVKAELQRISGHPTTFRTEIRSHKLTLADLLYLLSKGEKWTIPVSFLLEQVKAMRPRYYSISSAASLQPRRISITVVVDKPTEPVFRGCSGLATSFLRALEQRANISDLSSSPFAFNFSGPRNSLEGNKVYGRVRQSNFKLPLKASTAILMIGCGTGVAPFRAFMQDRAHRQSIGQQVGSTLLFMGFRHPDEDQIYEEDFQNAQEVLGVDKCKIYTAFSRIDPSRRTYVQDRLREHGSEILAFFEDQFCTRSYICGSAEMARDVVSTLVQIRSEAKGESIEQANAWVKSLRQFNLLLEDVWN